MPEKSYGRRKDDIMLPDLTPEIISKMTDSQKINVQILQSLNSINTRLNDIGHDVNIHDKMLVTGNGTPSLPERIRILEDFMGNIRYWNRFIGGAIVIQTVSSLGIMVVVMIRIFPLLEKMATP